MDEKAYWIAFNQVSGVGPVRLAALLEHFGSLETAWKAPLPELQAVGLDRRSLENLLAARRTVDPEREWERVRKAGITVLTWDDPDYPENLRQVDGAPPVLYVRGTLTQQDTWAVALVGTRRASAYGREVAHKLASELAMHGVTVVSGLALGIDTVAHKAALDAGGRTLAVLGSGVDQIYPPGNRGLAQKITASGGLISEYPLGTRPEASNFPPRNRIISGLSKGIIVVEAGQRSGALITARFAAEQGRDVFAVPGSILHPGSMGCNELIQQGAMPLLRVEDVLEQLHMADVQAQQAVRAQVPADPLEEQLLRCLSAEPRHVDEIVRESAMPSPQVASLLAIMELKGLVRQVGTLSYVRA
ncbi:DNA-processing protein DprA [Litorilinea aerophila]|uniref:DNA-protecting protein DprA n=1 Tax=Litorilinea aerophila TaxID=1204385 RepID=A0A540VL74_9CHLR|nr:DNA-processing protein DprA [Litorilinea aerophila]MCC9075177.1 DNA-processing protein DprA [Litorilinea aerophila]GIV78183.1 MAG: DNA processing protein DprA [Litorilinea sp.]